MNTKVILQELQDFDFSNIDYNNAGSWPLAVKAIAAAVVAGIILVAGWWFFTKDIPDRIVAAERKEETAKSDFKTKAFKAANLTEYKLQLEEMNQKLSSLLEQLPTNKEVSGFHDDLTRTATRNGLENGGITPQADVARGDIIAMPVSMEVKGSYHELGTWVSSIASLDRIVTLGDYTIKLHSSDDKSNGGSTASILSMSILAETFYYDPTSNAGGNARARR